jgi:hypothetical protein
MYDAPYVLKSNESKLEFVDLEKLEKEKEKLRSLRKQVRLWRIFWIIQLIGYLSLLIVEITDPPTTAAVYLKYIGFGLLWVAMICAFLVRKTSLQNSSS